ncbi:MAG: hypothetical protein GX951_02095 [Mollicutes bacterium]|nr:hypothetical protein [Mollicutes bacterium]
MKEATGELSAAVVIAVVVAILITFFLVQIWPIIRANYKAQTSCDKATCASKPADNNTKGKVWCSIDGSVFECPYKG